MEIDHSRQKLLDLAEERAVSLSSLSRLIGKNPSYLQQFLKKGSPKKLEENDRAILAQFFGVAESDLKGAQEKSYNSATSGQQWVVVPRLSLQASAGPGATVGDESAIGSFHFSQRWLRDQGLQSSRLSTIVVRGDSMEPTLRDGDEIMIDHQRARVRDGIHVVRLDGVLMVKRLATSGIGQFTLISDNPAYPPIPCIPADVEVVGRAVWKSGRL